MSSNCSLQATLVQQPAACCQGTKSLCVMCRHVKEGRGNQACLLWEGNELSQSRKMTYKQVLDEVSRLVSCCAYTSLELHEK